MKSPSLLATLLNVTASNAEPSTETGIRNHPAYAILTHRSEHVSHRLRDKKEHGDLSLDRVDDTIVNIMNVFWIEMKSECQHSR